MRQGSACTKSRGEVSGGGTENLSDKKELDVPDKDQAEHLIYGRWRSCLRTKPRNYEKKINKKS